MTTLDDKHSLKNKFGVSNASKKLGDIAMTQQILKNFINNISSIPGPRHLKANDHVPSDIINDANDVLDQIADHLGQAQKAANGFLSDIDKITDSVEEADRFARHGRVLVDDIMSEIISYKKHGGPVDKDKIETSIKRMISTTEDLQVKIKTAHNKVEGDTSTLEPFTKKLNGDLEDLESAVPDKYSAHLNLEKLTEKQAKKKLQDDIDDINKKIESLKSEMDSLTAGEIATGVIGGLIAVTNWWNPIGWAAAAGTVAGDVEMAGEHAQDAAKLSEEQIKLGVAKAEEDILKPYYAVKNAVSQLESGIQHAESMTNSLEALKDNLKGANEDLDTFLRDVTANASLNTLQEDAQFLKGDYKHMAKIASALVNPLPHKTVSIEAMANAKQAPGT